MSFVQLRVLVGFKLLMLPNVAHETGYRWWAYITWGAGLGTMLAIPFALLDGFIGANRGRPLWIVINFFMILEAFLRLVLTNRRY